MRAWAIIYTIVFLIFGIVGFIPQFHVNGRLFALFEENAALNILYLLTGGFALWVSLMSRRWMRLYFQVVGIIYGIIAIGGFALLDREVLFFLANNSNNTWFAVCVAVIALILGFSLGAKK